MSSRLSSPSSSLFNRTSSMYHPGPLQELPLELFMPNPNLLNPTSFKSNKRPLSPSAPILYSPAKRRILNEEGIFSPEKTRKTPLPASRGSQSFSAARLEDIFAGPSSPALKLDFGSPKNLLQYDIPGSLVKDVGDLQTSSHASSSSLPLSHSPPKATIGSKSVTDISLPLGNDYKEPDDYFFPSSPTFVPRELPPYPDPHSIHYPGFLIYRDPHLISLPVSHPPLFEHARRQLSSKSDDANAALGLNASGLGRNLHTPRKSSITFTPSRKTPMMSATLSCRPIIHGVAKSTPRLSKDERREMRRLLEEEVNYAESGDDSESLTS
ncbi:hypothetical protein BDQ17DRAFT_1351919 [Cyathus striatus]|nr:hypothetical protein BDQ17DRAFT_1351919 [Cyathus striatus]